jgi:glutaredoxin-dependent peroxiredoxin
MAITIGQVAPDFTLSDSENNPVTLSGLKGKNVLLLFYPKAFTRVCTKELCDVRDNIARYQSVNASVFGISVDPVNALAQYKEEYHYNFQLLSDIDKEVSLAYDSIYYDQTLNIPSVSKRSAFVIDKDGIVRHAEVLEDASLVPDFEKINSVLDSLG